MSRRVDIPHGSLRVAAKTVAVTPNVAGSERAVELIQQPPKPIQGLTVEQTALKRWFYGLPSNHYFAFLFAGWERSDATPMLIIEVRSTMTYSGHRHEYIYRATGRKLTPAQEVLDDFVYGTPVTFERVLSQKIPRRYGDRMMDFFFGKRRR